MTLCSILLLLSILYKFLQQLKQEHANTVYMACQVATQLLKIGPSHFRSQAPYAMVPELAHQQKGTWLQLPYYALLAQ